MLPHPDAPNLRQRAAAGPVALAPVGRPLGAAGQGQHRALAASDASEHPSKIARPPSARPSGPSAHLLHELLVDAQLLKNPVYLIEVHALFRGGERDVEFSRLRLRFGCGGSKGEAAQSEQKLAGS